MTSLSFTKLFVIILHWNIWHLYLLQSNSSSSYTVALKHLTSLFFYKAIRHHPALIHFTSLYFTKLFVIILHWNIWHFYLLQRYSSSSYTKTVDIFIFYKAIRHHPTLTHLTSLSYTKLFVIILHWNIWHLYLLHSYSSLSYTKTFDIFIFYKVIRYHPTLYHLTSLSFTTLFVIILH